MWGQSSGSCTLKTEIQGVSVVKVNISGFNFRTDSESKTSYTHGSNLQQFRRYEILKYSK